jgi:alpha-1,4-digalacturonate transport system permease protein
MLMNLIDAVVDPIQRRIGIHNMAYFFLLPNLLIFSIFVLFPMLLNIYYAFTGGTQLFLAFGGLSLIPASLWCFR